MANVKISGLPAASGVAGTNEFEINESGTSKKVTGSQIASYVDSTLSYLDAADIGVSVQAYDVDIPTVAASQAEMEAGTEAALRSMSPLRVKQAITALSPSAVGKQTIWIPAAAMSPRTTNGAAFNTTQLGTNGTLVSSLAFDTATAEYAQFQIRMPKSWNESTVTFTPVWTANSTSTNGVAWSLQAKALGNDGTIDAAWGTAVTVTDANTATAYQVHIASESSAVTIANASELEWVVFEIYRDVSNGGDTLAVDALLLGVTINYTTDAANDA